MVCWLFGFDGISKIALNTYVYSIYVYDNRPQSCSWPFLTRFVRLTLALGVLTGAVRHPHISARICATTECAHERVTKIIVFICWVHEHTHTYFFTLFPVEKSAQHNDNDSSSSNNKTCHKWNNYPSIVIRQRQRNLFTVALTIKSLALTNTQTQWQQNIAP